MKLRALEAFFSKYYKQIMPWGIVHECFKPVASLAEADGIWFLCPKCFATDHHMVRIGFHGKATPGTYGYNKDGQPVLWNLAGGAGLDDLQLTPSIQLQGGCWWHGFVGSSGVPAGEAV